MPKGWKIVERGKYTICWRNIKTQKELCIYDLGIRKYAVPSHKWSAHYDGNILFRNKTKVQAKSFAIKYMRKHPNG